MTMTYTSYAVHYNANAGTVYEYDPALERFDTRHSRFRPLCKTRGRKNITPDWDNVTCSACLSKCPTGSNKLKTNHKEGKNND